MNPTGIVEQVLETLGRHGVRATNVRRLVAEALAAGGGPQSAADLDERLRPRVPLSSLYRTLSAFEAADVVDKYYDPAGVARYEIAERLTGEHHHHLVCIRCGVAVDIAVTSGLESAIDRLVAATEDLLGCEVAGHRLELEGVCAACRQ
jgi:Fe2+ or Zn2+ uptake regulation protein